MHFVYFTEKDIVDFMKKLDTQAGIDAESEYKELHRAL